MATLKIPDRYRPGIAILAGLPSFSYDELLAAAKRAPKTFASTRELEAWLESEVKSIPPRDLLRVVDSIGSLYRISTKFKVEVPRLAADVLEAAQTLIGGFKPTEGSDFIGRLSALLAQGSFDILSFKARELQTQAERTFCEARILTDVRPVFGENVGDSPIGTIVIHTLKLVFHEMSGHREIYLALDDEDIKSLKGNLERAEEKARTITAILTAKDLRPIDLP